MRRRNFIALLGGAAAGWPLAARAQQVTKPARLGYIWIGAKDSEHSTRDGLSQGLRDLGYIEGNDYVLEERYAESQPDRLPGIIAELLQLKVALFLSPGVQVTQALIASTSTIPIIAQPACAETHPAARSQTSRCTAALRTTPPLPTC